MKVAINAIRIILLIIACFLSFALIVSITEFMVNSGATPVDLHLLKELTITVCVAVLLWYVAHATYKNLEF